MRIVVVALLGLLTTSAGAQECEVTLDRPSFNQAQIDAFQNAFAIPFSNKAIQTFWREGLPELHRIASENDITVAQVLDNLHASLKLTFEVLKIASKRELESDDRLREMQLAGLDRLVGRPKLKANHYPILHAGFTVVLIGAVTAAHSEIMQTGLTKINPYAPVTAAYVNNLLIASEEGLLDHALTTFQFYRSENDRAKEEARMNKLERRLRALEPEPPAPEPDPTSVDEAVARDAPAVEPRDTIDQTNLGLVLKQNAPLSSDVRYDALTPRGTALTVSLAPSLMAQHDGGDHIPIRRLLRGILVGRGHAGIKILQGLGRGIIEVKAVLHGHKRLLGCLEGRHVRLLRLIDIKADSSTYARRIPRNLCDE